MTDQQKNNIPMAIIITILLSVFGWLIYRLEGIDAKLDTKLWEVDTRIDQHSERITSLEGYKETLEAIQEIKKEYERENKPLNFEGFLEFVMNKSMK